VGSHNNLLMSWPVCPLLGQNNLKSILFNNPVADLRDRMSPSQDAGFTVLPWETRGTDLLLLSLDFQTQQVGVSRITCHNSQREENADGPGALFLSHLR
jgi:hypothetical protein